MNKVETNKIGGPPVVSCVNDVKVLLKRNFLMPGDKSRNRLLLEEGFKLIEHRILYNKQLNSNLNVDDMGGWIRLFVRDKLGGKIKGTKVCWQLKDRTITLDPITCEITEEKSG